MIWLAGGALYSIAYLMAGSYLRGHGQALLWLRIVALLIPPLTGIFIIARRRRDWMGCQWLFWATVALGLTMMGIGVVGWTVDEVLLGRETSWLGWYTVFALFGAVAPLLALLTQPHRGAREPVTASIAVDMAGIAVMTGFLYSHFAVGADLAPLSSHEVSVPLLLLHEFQQILACAAFTIAALAARGQPWAATYRRLALGLMVGLVILTISNLGIVQGLYESGGVYDLIWILPFAFFAWAAADAPSSNAAEDAATDEAMTPSRPWVVFAALAALPLADFWLRKVIPLGAMESFRDFSMAITIFSVLPLLVARLAVQSADAHQADRRRLLLATATEQAGDLISIMTPAGQVEYANTAFCRALGCEATAVSRMTLAEFVAEESSPQLAEMRAALRIGGAWHGTLMRRRLDESTFRSTCSIVALRDRAGTLTNFVAVERDTTHEALLRDQLVRNERLAAVGQLVSGVAHEINNPLQAIVGFTELLIVAERRIETREDLEQIRTAAHRAAKIVRSLLAFVRRAPTERSVVNLNELMESTVALRRYVITEAGIELEETYADGLPPVLVNREEIQQILLNLVLNAEQAMRIAGIRGRLSVRTGRMGSSDLVVEIRDTGPGVPSAIAGRIFEPFFTTRIIGEGTGLGLSLALGIAEAHGGSLTLLPVASGACFRLTLPVGINPPTAMPRMSGRNGPVEAMDERVLA